MPYTKCPICSERYSNTFIETHAATCKFPIKDKIQKKNKHLVHSSIQKKQRQLELPKNSSTTKTTSLLRLLSFKPKCLLSPPADAPSSETGAPGFHIFPNIFNDVNDHLIHVIETTPPDWVDYVFRQVKSYGPAYNLKRRRFLFGPNAPKQIPMPKYAKDIVLPRVQRTTELLHNFNPNQLAVGIYKVPGGCHILPHNDCENGRIATAVVGVCLGAKCTMTLILRKHISGLSYEVKKDICLPKGAVYVMTGDALRKWEHAIFPRKTEATRYSLTFRDVSPHDDAYLSKVAK